MSAKDAACELRCRLVALRWLLPQIPEDLSDMELRTAPASGPPPPALGDPQKPIRLIVTEVTSAPVPFEVLRWNCPESMCLSLRGSCRHR